jgi:hypothetical protein
MEEPVLTERDQFPTEEVIFSHIGRGKRLWVLLFEEIHRDHPEFTEEWRYYLDGRSWLLKVSRKRKTIFWLSIVEGSFRTTFYFADKAREAIAKSALSDDVKEQYRNAERYGKIRGVTIRHRRMKDVDDARRLIDIKIGIG